MKILAIETSCDETAVALIEAKKDSGYSTIRILGNGLLSQTPIHSLMGGVVPSLAKREHANNLVPMLALALGEAKAVEPITDSKPVDSETAETLRKILEREPGLYDALVDFIPTFKKPDIDAIAVTQGPGLEPALWVGINFAKALSVVWNIPVTPINHMEGHILSALLVPKGANSYELPAMSFPFLSLLISGGHTELVLSKTIGYYEVIGETRDDAVGEAFDKVARILGLPYPGGPQISKLAEEARGKNIEPPFELPRPMLRSGDYDFSFAGLKTAVLYGVKKIDEMTEIQKMGIAREFEDAATEVLLAKTQKALEETGAQMLAVGGGVIANKNIRKKLTKLVEENFKDVSIFLPSQELTTDNAVMIALAAHFRLSNTSPVQEKEITASGSWRLGS